MTYFVKPHRRFMLTLCTLVFVLLQALSFGVVVVYAIAVILATRNAPNIGDNVDTVSMLVVGVSSFASVLLLMLLGGKRAVAFCKEDILYTLSKSKYFIVLALLQLLLSLTAVFTGEQTIISTWPASVARTFIFCVFVGISEEATYRGIVLGGLLARFGKTRKGFYAGIFIAALIFGIMHVTPNTQLTAINVAQLVLKVVQTGILGLFFSALALRRVSFWGSAFIHFLWDFILLSGGALVSKSVEISYVASGEEGVMVAIYYLVIIVLQIPLVVSAFRIFKSTSTPYCGWLSDVVTLDQNGNELIVTSPELVAAVNSAEQATEAVLAQFDSSQPQVAGMARSVGTGAPAHSQARSVPVPPTGFYDLSSLEDPAPRAQNASDATSTGFTDSAIQQQDDRPPRPMGL